MRDAAMLVVGLGLLTYAADQFVLGAVRLAAWAKVSVVIIGAVIIGFGTSAPELLVSASAASRGSQDIAVGNVVGSNMANVLLVVGTAATLGYLPITVRIWRQEIRLMLAAVALLAAVAWDRIITQPEAIMLIVATVAAFGLIIRWAITDREAASELNDEIDEYADGPINVSASTIRTLLGMIGTVAGAHLLVVGASGLAIAMGLSEAVVGLTIVAIGTSLPELVTSAAAARRGENDLIIGNVVGSNIFNSLPVAGIAGVLDTRQLDPALPTGLVLMLVACVLFAVFARTSYRVTRWEGIVLLIAYVAALAVTF